MPTVNGPLPRLVVARSGTPITTVGSEATSLAPFTSPGVLTVAEFVTAGTAAAAGITSTVKLRLSPGRSGPACVATTIGPAALTVHPAPAPEANGSPAGSGSRRGVAAV